MNPFKKWEQVLGLDIGVRELKIVQLQPLSRGLYSLALADSLPLPEEEKEKIPFLKNYVLQQKLTGMPTAASFLGESLHIRPLELPKMPKEDLMEAIRWQMRDVAEESMENYGIRYSLLEEKILPDIVHLSLLTFCIRKEEVEKISLLLQKIGLKPVFIEPTPVAMAATLEHISPSEDRGWVGCADLGYRRPYFIVTGSGRLHFVRLLSGLTGLDILSEEYPSKLSVELQNALDAFFIGTHAEKIDKIFLSGGGASQQQLSTLLSKNLGTPFEALNPFQGVQGKDSFPAATQKPHLFGPAFGSALLKP